MIGKLDQRVTMQRTTATPDGAGGTTYAWGDLGTVWANVFTVRTGEAMTEGRMNAAALVVFTVRNRSDLDERDRIVWGGVAYNIRSIRREGQRPQFVKIEAERGVSQ